jgi:hypothetical protein
MGGNPMNAQFLEFVFDPERNIQHPNFFNGRILTAQDLQDEQTANLKRSRYLGQAIGEGVVYGLNVSTNSDKDALKITDGLAVNLRGDVLLLPSEITVELSLKEPARANNGPFTPCNVQAPTTTTGKLSTDGYYLLAITPATQGSENQASYSGSSSGNNSSTRTSCTNRYEEVGVQFKLVPLSAQAPYKDFVSPTADQAVNHRSVLAHDCFGTDFLISKSINPPTVPAQYGLVDRLRADKFNPLTDCDVPLAVFQFRNQQVQFVDVWSVRRPCSPGTRTLAYPASSLEKLTDLSEVFTQFTSSRRAIEAAAFLLQFQNQLEDLRTDNTVSPPKVVAKDYFKYLPAAGYLPVQQLQAGKPVSTSNNQKRFSLKMFFGHEIQPQQLPGTAFIRSLFHQSFYVDPIKPDTDGIDVYTIKDAPEAEPYVIFARKRQTPTIVTTPSTSTNVEEAVQTGDLYVAVVLTHNSILIPDVAIKSLTAINQKSKRRFVRYSKVDPTSLSGYTAGQLNRVRRLAEEGFTEKYGHLYDRHSSLLDDTTLHQYLYLFNNLPAGTYTINVETIEPKKYYGLADQVKVTANVENFITIPVRGRSTRKPGRPFIPAYKPIVVGGIRVGGGWFDPSWNERIPDWSKHLPGLDPGYVDPAPDDWTEVSDSDIILGIEEILSESEDIDPWVVTVDPKIYVSNTLNPTVPSESVNAFVQTKDGSRLPLVVQAVDNALNRSILVTRTEIRDFDQFATGRLEESGLAQLDAFVSAPTNLLAAVMGQSQGYVTNLVTESLNNLQENFRSGYMSYAGISKYESDALKTEFGTNADLAQVNQADISKALIKAKVKAQLDLMGIAESERTALKEKELILTYTTIFQGQFENFSQRLQVDTRSTFSFVAEMDQSRFSNLTDQQLDNLRTAGISSDKTFLDKAAKPNGRNELKEVLTVSDETLDRYLEDAVVRYATSKLFAQPDRSVGTLKLAEANVATKLAEMGYSSVKTLAFANAADLADEVGISEGEMARIITEAGTYVREASSTLLQGATDGAVSLETLTNAGFNSLEAVTKADRAKLEQVADIGAKAGRVQVVTGKFLENVAGQVRRIR